MAIIEVVINHIDEERRTASLCNVIDQLGPPDGCIIVKMADGSEFTEDETVNEVLEMFGDLGEIILVRYYLFLAFYVYIF